MNRTIKPRRKVLLQVWPLLLFGPVATPFLALLAVSFLANDQGYIQIRIFGALCVPLALATLALAVWPVTYALSAQLIVTPESVTKVYPFGMRRRTLSRRDLGRIDSYRMEVGSSVHTDRWNVIRFRNRNGKVVFKLGTNWWPPDQLRVLVDELQ